MVDTLLGPNRKGKVDINIRFGRGPLSCRGGSAGARFLVLIMGGYGGSAYSANVGRGVAFNVTAARARTPCLPHGSVRRAKGGAAERDDLSVDGAGEAFSAGNTTTIDQPIGLRITYTKPGSPREISAREAETWIHKTASFETAPCVAPT